MRTKALHKTISIGIKGLTYCQRLTKLKLESLELWHIRADLIFTYKLVLGFNDFNPSEFITVRVGDTRCGHRCKLYLLGCKSSDRYNFFSYRVARAYGMRFQKEK